MQVIFIFIFCSLGLLSFCLKSNVFTPSKLLLISFFVFWGGVFFRDYSDATYLACYFYFIVTLCVIIIEQKDISTYREKKVYLINKKSTIIKIWIITLLPIIAQVLLIIKMGGFSNYILSINLRVKEWQGLGIYLIFIRFILVINQFYFLLLIKQNKVRFKDVILFIIHFIVFVSIAFLSGSRSTLLVNLVLMAISYDLFRKKIKLVNVLIFSVAVIFSAVVLESVRTGGVSYEDGMISTGLDKSESKFTGSNFEYGLFQIEEIYNQKDNINFDPQYGLTYLSVITNLVPRKLWPNKPDPGGVVFTNNFHNVHDGYSNYSTGFLVEGVLNFGYVFGPFIGIFVVLIIYFIFFRYVHYVSVRTLNCRQYIIFFLIYPVLLYSLPSYFHGEFTTVTHSLFLSRIIPSILIVLFTINKKTEFK